MNSLIIDTASINLYVAISGDINKEIHVLGRNHSAVLMRKIDELLGVNKLADVDEIIVGVGPGSYTGARVAVTVGKMMAWTKGIKLKTISSLYIQASGYNGIRTSQIDARRGNAFCAVFDEDKMICEEALRALEDFTSQGQVITENDFKADPKKIVKYAKECKNVHALVPNYLRLTEAERNKNGN